MKTGQVRKNQKSNIAKKQFMRRGVAIIMTCAMTVIVTACGNTVPGSASSEPIDTTIDKNLIYKEKLLDFSSTPFQSADVNRAFVTGGKIRTMGQTYGDDGKGNIFSVTFDADGTGPNGQVLAETDNSIDFMSPTFDEDGNCYIVKLYYRSNSDGTDAAASAVDGDTADAPDDTTQGADEQNTDGENATVDGADGTGEAAAEEEGAMPGGKDPYDEGSMTGLAGEGIQSMDFALVKIDPSGNQVFETPMDVSGYMADYEYFNVSNMRVIQGLGVAMESNAGITLYSAEDGTVIRELYKIDPGAYVDFRMAGDGTYYALVNGSSQLQKINLETGEVGEALSIPSELSSQGFFVSPGVGCDFYAGETDGIVSWNIGDETTKRIVGFTESDLAIENLDNIAGIDENHIMITYSTTDINGAYTVNCSVLEKIKSEEYVDKKVLTIGVNEVDTQLRNMIVAFNKKSDVYKIKLIDYSRYNTEDDYLAGSKKYNADLISGNAPDMMYMDPSQSLQALQAKGIFEPLDDYIANDSELAGKEFMESVLDVYKHKGVTYMLVPSFTAYSYAMKTSEAKRLRGWNLQTLTQMILKEKLDKALAFGFPMTKSQFLQMALIYDAGSYMDWNSGEAKFKEAQFMNLLNFTKDLPDNAQDYLTVDSWQELESAFRRDKAIVAQGIMNNYLDFTRLKYGTFGTDISFVGFPREENVGGGAVSASCLVSMSVDASDKEGCWQFLRAFYLDEFQDSVVALKEHFPVGKTQMDQMAEEATHRPFFTDGDGVKQEYDNVFEVSGQEVKIPVLSSEDQAQMYAFFDSIDTAVHYDNVVYNIITEEAGPFFQGEKTAEECANVIQSKVQIYMDENS